MRVTAAQAEALVARLGRTYPAVEGFASVFSGLPSSQTLQCLRLPAGHVLFDEGDACSGFPLVLSGCIRVVKASSHGREIVLYRVHPGQGCVLTGACLLGQVSYRARGVAESALELVLLSTAQFESLLDRAPAFRRWVFAQQAERLTVLLTRVEALAFQRIDARLAACLLERSANGTRVVHATHQNLADELGTVREIVTRALHQLADDGLVELGREQVRVRDAAALAQRASA